MRFRLSLLWLAALALLAFVALVRPSHAAGASPLEALSLSAGVQGRWLDGGIASGNRDLELAGNAALGLTPHVDLTGGIAYGFDGSYIRAQADARLCATDAHDPDFNVWVGVGRYFSKRPTDGLNEMAGKAGLGWRPFPAQKDEFGNVTGKGFPVVIGLTTAVALKGDRRCLTISAVVPIVMTKGGR